MSDADLLADRKRLKRHLSSWRILAIVVLFGALALVANGMGVGSHKGAMPGSGYIAQISVEGIMTDDEERDKMLEDIRDDKSAKALLVSFNSPGGTTVGGEELFVELRKVAAKKPVVGVMRTLCASACYMASLATDHVVAREGTLTGSIGVLLQSAEVSRLADKLGITPITIKSGKFKDVPSLTDPFTPEEREVVQQLVMNAYDNFIDMIVARRGFTREEAIRLSDGRVYTGRQAVPLKLIDGIGGVDEAKAWLVSEKKLDPSLEIRAVDEKPQLNSLFSMLSQWTGIEIFNRSAIGLDGLISIWQHPGM